MMKKITLILFALAAFSRPSFGQAVISVDAPQYNGDFSAFVGPNGFTSSTLTIAYHRACYLISQAELSRMVLTNSIVTDFGFDIFRPANVACTGQFTLYLQNTTDVTYNKGTSFPALLTGMSTNFNGNLVLPTGSQNATTSVSVPLSNTFTYTGGSMYVAFDWHTTTPTSTITTRYLTHADGPTTNLGCNSSAPSAGPAPTTLTLDVRRPAMRFKATNTATNEVGVVSIQAPGLVSKLVNPGHTISATLRNNGVNPLSNVQVSLNVSGANTFNNVQAVNIPAGGTVNVNFTGFTPSTNGLNTMSVLTSSDQYNDNNGVAWTQTVNCSDYGNNPPYAAATFSSGSYGYGGQAIIATPLKASSTCSMTGIKFAPGQLQSGTSSITGVLLDAGGFILATTNTVNVTTGSFGTYLNLTFTNSPAIELTGGSNYYYGIAQLSSSTFPFGTRAVLATTNLNLYYTVPIAGGSIGSPQNHMGYLGLQAVLGFSNTTIEATASETVVCKGSTSTVTLTAIGGSSTFTWTPGNLQGSSVVVTPTIANVNGGIVNYQVTGTDAATGCKSNTYLLQVKVDLCTALSSNTSNGYDLKLFPNPATNGKSTISGFTGTNIVTVYNSIGQVVLTQSVSEDTMSLDLSNQPAGNYLVKITGSDSESRIVKVVNQR
ncbi:T9SS type A sorting domain-containing protein [Aurantibacillus circumpalustris]|uniref:T9SS type A sorting domain-containing protein n=1 Tax=Aurantibacillus circumpalustris TaxID=3036359 RepID=UPI00295C2C05|nr:T9SS type A sorting domain-containing protein [Aurantibacillus circumpalustris]